MGEREDLEEVVRGAGLPSDWIMSGFIRGLFLKQRGAQDGRTLDCILCALLEIKKVYHCGKRALLRSCDVQ